MNKLLELIKQKKQLIGIIAGAAVLAAAAVFVIVAVVSDSVSEEPIDEIELNLADTDGMDFNFADDDLAANDDGEAGQVIDLGGGTEPTEKSTEPSETEAPNPSANGEGDKPAEEPKTEDPVDPTEEPTERPSEDNDPDDRPVEKTDDKPVETPEQPTERPTEKPTEPETEEPGTGESELVHITAGGTYTLTGNKTDVMITVDAGEDDVTIILNGVTVKNRNGPAIYVRSAKKVYLTLASGTVNTLSDGSSYSITDSGSTLDAAVFCKSDLTVNGSGTLNVTGNYKHGVASKDNLVISSGTLNVTAKNVALGGKDSVKINDGNITLKAGSDGIRADNTVSASKGYVYLYGGTVKITAGNDGIQAQTVLNIEDVELAVTAGGGSGSALSTTDSHKGLKAGSDIYITGGAFTIDTLDDCIHANGTVTISGGGYTLSTGDDAIHADADVAVSGSGTKLTVAKSYEGIEATNILITGGDIALTATDDGINAAGGNDPSGGQSGTTGKVVISGGKLTVKVGGDGIDANGTVALTGGNVTISVADTSGRSMIDCDNTGEITGGTFIGLGDITKAKNMSESSAQGVILADTGAQAAGTAVTVTDANGKVILTVKAEQAYSCVLISAPEIVKDGKYTLTAGNYKTEITMSSLVYG